MKLSFRSNLEEFISELSAKVRATVPLATAIAMTATAQDVQQAVKDEMEAVFDRPTPYTINSVQYTPAQRTKLEASVFINDQFVGNGGHPAGEYLIPEIEGGLRVEKRSEFILRQLGMLRDDQFIVPGRGAPLDQYGNLTGGFMQQVLSAIGASEATAGHTSDRPTGPLNTRQQRTRAKQATYFVANRHIPQTQHLHPGIWRKEANDKLTPIVMFVQRPSYSGVLDFERVASEATELNFENHLREQLAISIERVG